MGAAAFFGQVANRAEQHAALQRQQQEEARTSQRAIYTGVLANPNATSDQRAYAIDNLNKLNQGAGAKKGDSPYDKLGGLLTHVGDKLQQAGHPEASNPGVLHTLPKLDGTPSDVAAPMVDASTQQSAVKNLPPMGEIAGIDSGSSDPGTPTSQDASQPATPSDTTQSLPSISSTPLASAHAANPISTTPSFAGATPPTPQFGTPAHAFLTGVQHGAGHVLSTIGQGMGTVKSALTPVNDLPPLAGNIDPSMIPSPVPPQLKFDPNPIEGASIDPSGVDRFGNQIDPTKKYVAAPDPRGGVIINGRPYSVQTSVPKPSGASPRSLGATISMDDARNLQQSGQPVLNEHGQPYDLSKVPANMKFQAVGLPGGGVGYLLGTEKQVKRTNGNENYIVNEFEQADPNKYVATGVARTATASQTETPVLDADGVVHMVPKYSSHSPVTSGVSGTAAQLPGGAVLNPQQPTALPGNPANVDLTNPHSTTGIPTPHPPRAMIPQNQQPGAPAPKQTASTPPNSSMGRAIPGAILPGQANQLRNRDTALNGARRSFELATQPDPGTNQSYLDLFRDPNSPKYKAVAKFLKLSDNMAARDGTPNSEGYFSTLASYGLGLPGMVANSQNEALKDAYADVVKTGGEGAVVDRYNLLGNVGGMRKGSGGNASKWNFDNSAKEIPSAEQGDNYRAALDKMHRLTSELNSYADPNLTVKKFDQSILDRLPSGGGTNAPAEGAAKVNSHGDKVVYHSGKWGPA